VSIKAGIYNKYSDIIVKIRADLKYKKNKTVRKVYKKKQEFLRR